jgi:hypothetical protein
MNIGMQLLEFLSHELMETEQITQLLGPRPTKLYHHLKTRARAGLSMLMRIQTKTSFKNTHYTAVAQYSAVNHRRLKPQLYAKQANESHVATNGILDNTFSDVRRNITHRHTRPHNEYYLVFLLFLLSTAQKTNETIGKLLSENAYTKIGNNTLLTCVPAYTG